MMMPANFSAVAENEMSYVIGGGIGEILADPMTKTQWKNFNTNLVKVIGNNYVTSFLSNSIGKVFGGTYTPGDVIDAFGGTNGKIWYNFTNFASDATGADKAKGYALGVLNIALNVVGNAAAIYNLGFGTVKNTVSESQFNTTVSHI